MEDLKSLFPGCKFETEKIRENIKKILKVDDSVYFCYKCFRLIGPYNKAFFCKRCYQPYCKPCASQIFKVNTYYIEVAKCSQCIENNKKIPLLYEEDPSQEENPNREENQS